MTFFKRGLMVLGISVFSLHSLGEPITLSELKKGTNQTIYAGSTSGLVHASIDSVNSMANEQYRDNQSYSSSSSSSGSSSSNSTSTTSSSSRTSSSSSSSSRSTGVKEIYNAGTKTKGYTNYRVNCESGSGTTVHQRSDGFWYSGGSNMGERYRHLSKQDFGNKYCK